MVVRQFELDYKHEYDSYVQICRTCYYDKGGAYNFQTSIELPGFVSEVVFASYIEINESEYGHVCHDKDLLKHVNGKVYVHKNIEKYANRVKISEEKETLNFFFMPPSFSCILRVRSRSYMKDVVARINTLKSTETKDLA